MGTSEGRPRFRDFRFEAQFQPVARRAQQLELRDLGAFFDHRRQGQRQQPHLVMPRVAQHQRVVGAALHLDRRKAAAAGTAFAQEAHAVAQLVAQQRLRAVGQVGQQHRVRSLAGRHRPQLTIHRFQDQPVVVQVQAALRTFPGHGIELGRAVVVAQRAAEGGADAQALLGRQLLATHPHLRQRQVHRAFGLQLRQRVGATGVADQHRRREVLQLRGQPGQRLLHRKGLHHRRQPWQRRARRCAAAARCWPRRQSARRWRRQRHIAACLPRRSTAVAPRPCRAGATRRARRRPPGSARPARRCRARRWCPNWSTPGTARGRRRPGARARPGRHRRWRG